VTADSELAAIRAVARTLRNAETPVPPSRASALSSSLDHSARALGRALEWWQAEATGQQRAVELGDREPYLGLDLAQAAAVLAERARRITYPVGTEQLDRELAAEVDAFLHSEAVSAPRTAATGRGVAAVDPGATGPGAACTGASPTSKAAALAAEPRTGSNRRRVLDAVAAVARDPRTVGLTDVEIQRATGLNPNSARPRRRELVMGGWLEDSGRTREHHGREHAVWVLTEKAEKLTAGFPAAS